MTPVRIAAGVLVLAGVPGILLLSARDGGTPAATETPASMAPPSSVPAPSSTVEPTTTVTAPNSIEAAPTTVAATTVPPGGEAATPPGEWPKIGGDVAYCVTPWGAIEPAWCSERVYFWRRLDPATGEMECWVTPAGQARQLACTQPDTGGNPPRLPETA